MYIPDWDDAPEWANYVAMDVDGNWFWFENEPEYSHRLGVWEDRKKDRIATAGQSAINAAESLRKRES